MAHTENDSICIHTLVKKCKQLLSAPRAEEINILLIIDRNLWTKRVKFIKVLMEKCQKALKSP